MTPESRREQVLTQAVGNELVLYDERTNEAHRLNPTAAFVWRSADGARSVPELAARFRASLATPDGAPPLDYAKLYEDIRESIDTVHRDDSLKTRIKADISRYIYKDPELGPALHRLRSGGKKLFILTNSLWDYTDEVLRYLLDGVVPATRNPTIQMSATQPPIPAS